MRSPASSIAALAGAAALALFAGATPAFAHNSVVDQAPEEDEVVTAQPGEVWIETNDELLDLDGATAMDVIGPDDRHYATACPAVDGAIASAPMELGPAGEYTVAWRVVSADGHPITGDFTFEWAPAAGEPVAEGAAQAACASSDTGDAAPGPDDAVDEADEPAAAASVAGTELAWIAGAVAVAVGAGVAAFLLTRRRPAPETAPISDAGDGTSAPPGAGPTDADRPDDR